MPSPIKIPHPFRPDKTLASAFVVEAVIYPLEPFQLPAVRGFLRPRVLGAKAAFLPAVNSLSGEVGLAPCEGLVQCSS